MIHQAPSPNYSSRRGTEPDLCVIHYTAGGSAGSTVRWFQMPESKVSAHYVISRDGTVYQCVQLSQSAWHAGASKWRGQRGVNTRSVGIELANYGRLMEDDGTFFCTRGRNLVRYFGPSPIHAGVDWWEPYPIEQMDALRSLINEIEKELGYELKLLGHEHVSPGRKFDPGPAFPWWQFRNADAVCI